MTTLTPNYSLTTYAATGGDEASTFLNFRTALAGTSNSNMTKIDTALAALLKLDGTRSMTGNLTTTGSAIIGSGTNGQTEIQGGSNGAIELGKPARTVAGTPFIDFHSSSGSPDYDSRIIASGGTGTSGQGTLTINALNVYKNSEALSGKIGFTMVIDGGDFAITPTTASKVIAEIPCPISINKWTLTSIDGTSGSVSVIIEKTTYSGFPSTGWSTLATISISSSTKSTGSVSWSFAEDELIRARISGTPTAIKKLGISFKGIKT